MRRRTAWVAAVFGLACTGLIAVAQTPPSSLRIEQKGPPLSCNSLYSQAPFDKPFEASCIVRGEADAAGGIRATDASCDRADIVALAKACLENYRVTEAWRPKTTSVCTEMNFSRPQAADSKYNGATISGATMVSWVDKCPPPGATRDPERASAVYVTTDGLPDEFKNLPPGLFPPGAKVTTLADLPPEIQKAIAAGKIEPAREPLRITQDFDDKGFQDCFKPAAGKKAPFEQSCEVTGEVDKKGKVGKTKASCADKSLEKPAERCVGSYKLMDKYKGYQGPVCVTVTYIAAPKTAPDGKTAMSAFHKMELCKRLRESPNQ